jgi:hypothetical protein
MQKNPPDIVGAAHFIKRVFEIRIFGINPANIIDPVEADGFKKLTSLSRLA